MATKKTLNIGLIGGGFMGRTHSNGYLRIANFFPDLAYTPVLKAVCFRNETKLKAFAEQWGYESIETDDDDNSTISENEKNSFNYSDIRTSIETKTISSIYNDYLKHNDLL